MIFLINLFIYLLLSGALIFANCSPIEKDLNSKSLKEVGCIKRVKSDKDKDSKNAHPLTERRQVEELLDEFNVGGERGGDEADTTANQGKDGKESLCFVTGRNRLFPDNALELRTREDSPHVHEGVNSGRKPENNDYSFVDNGLLGVSPVPIASVDDVRLEGNERLSDTGKTPKDIKSDSKNI